MPCRRGDRPALTTRERLFLTPIEKLFKYGIVPGKLLLGLLLLVLVTGQLLATNAATWAYSQAASRNFYWLFFPPDYDFSTPIEYVYTVEDAVGTVARAVSNYYHVNELSPDAWGYDGGAPSPPLLTLTSYTSFPSLTVPDGGFVPSTATAVYSVNETYLGPLSGAPGDVRSALNALVVGELAFPPLHTVSVGSGLYATCVSWGVTLVFDFSARGQIAFTLESEVLGPCAPPASLSERIFSRLQWLHVAIVVLSVVSAVLQLRSLVKSARLLRRLLRWAQERGGEVPPPPVAAEGTGEGLTDPLLPSTPTLASPRTKLRLTRGVGVTGFSVISAEDGSGEVAFSGAVPGVEGGGVFGLASEDAGAPPPTGSSPVIRELVFEADSTPGLPPGVIHAATSNLTTSLASLSLAEKRKFFNGWVVLALCADVCNMCASGLALADGSGTLPTRFGPALLSGAGIALLWLGTVRYMEHDRSFFSLILVLRRAAPRVLKYLVGVLPIFVAFALFAVVVWGDRVPRFATVQTSFVTLFSNLNGDVVRETFMLMVDVAPITGQLFFYAFISLHIYVVLNIVIAVVEESYFVTVAKTAELRGVLAGGDRPPGWVSGEGGGAPGEGREAVVDPLATPARHDINSSKLVNRPDTKLSLLLRLSEWDEVLLSKGGGSGAQ